MVAANAFVEWAHVHANRYGTSKKAIEDRMAEGADVILRSTTRVPTRSSPFFQRHFHFILPPSFGRTALRGCSAAAKTQRT